MFKKELKAEYAENEIIVNNWYHPDGKDSEARLYLNGNCVDASAKFISLASTPLLRGNIQGQDGLNHKVEVFFKSGLFSVKIKILVDGLKVAGDDF